MRIDLRHILIIVLSLLLGAALLVFIQATHFTSWDFRNNLWAPAHLLTQGQSPYRVEVLFDNSRAVWLPMAPGLLFWLGWLNPYQGSGLWLVLNIIGLAMLVRLSADQSKPDLKVFLLSMMLVVVFPPTLSHLVLGQFTLAIGVALLGAARWIERPRLGLVGLMIALALTKPQLAVPGSLGLMIYTWLNWKRRAVIQLIGFSALWTIVLTIPFWIGYPNWLGDFWASLQQNPTWAQPALFSVATRWWGIPGALGWLIGVLAAVFSLWQVWRKRAPVEAMIWSLGLTTLISPYLWSWDFVLLLPLLVRIVFGLKSKGSALILGAGYALCWLVMVWIRLTTENSDERYWWFPPVLFAVLAGVYLIDQHQTRAAAITEELA